MPHADFVPSLAWTLPFAAMLLGIALIPLAAPHFWESNAPYLKADLDQRPLHMRGGENLGFPLAMKPSRAE